MLELKDSDKILKVLPHRYPFLLVDRVEQMEIMPDGPIGSWISGIKNVSFNEPVFQGHFPDFPLYPGVLTIESLAQLAAILVFHLVPGGSNKFDVFLTGVDNIRFRQPVLPGNTLHLKATVTKERSGVIWACHAEAKVNGNISCEGDLMASMIAKKGRC